MRLRLLLQAILLSLVWSSTAHAKLLPTSLEAFLQKSSCGLLIQVVAVEPFQFTSPPKTAWLKNRNRIAEAIVQEFLVSDDSACQSIDGNISFLIATEVHSSHPKVGDRAVIFLVEEDGYLVEAVYGRSYWRVEEIHGDPFVQVDWRNDFLIAPLTAGVTGEIAYLPLGAIRRMWKGLEE